VSASFPYDRAYDPPAPVVPLLIAPPGGESGALVGGLLDSGADCTLIPPSLARTLRLPTVGFVEIAGVGGGGGSAPAYAGQVDLAGTRFLARLVAYEDHVIIGRDLLNRFVTTLDGLRLEVGLSGPGHQAR